MDIINIFAAFAGCRLILWSFFTVLLCLGEHQ